MIDYLAEYERVSGAFSAEMQKHEDVEGVVFLGGVARSRADVYSDIDIAVFSDHKLGWLTTGEQETPEGYDLEVFNIVMEKGFEDWDEIKKEAYQEGKIDFDRSGKTEAFLNNALAYSDDLQAQKCAELIFAIAWHGWIYTPFRNQTAKGYRWLLTEKLWFYRGEEKNAFYTTRYCVDLFIELLFAINKRWTPDYKWRYIRSRSLPWLPEHYEDDIDSLLFGAYSQQTWQEQSEKFQALIDQAVSKASEYLPDDWYSLI